VAASDNFLSTERILDSKRNGPKFYEENITIEFKATLGCGACIRGEYIYCIPGAEGSDPATWAADT
jgi:hypothetical protein